MAKRHVTNAGNDKNKRGARTIKNSGRLSYISRRLRQINSLLGFMQTGKRLYGLFKNSVKACKKKIRLGQRKSPKPYFFTILLY
jgi:hypothetical protein